MNLYLLEQTAERPLDGVFGLLIAAKDSKTARKAANEFVTDNPTRAAYAAFSTEFSRIRKIGETSTRHVAPGVVSVIAQN